MVCNHEVFFGVSEVHDHSAVRVEENFFSYSNSLSVVYSPYFRFCRHSVLCPKSVNKKKQAYKYKSGFHIQYIMKKENRKSKQEISKLTFSVFRINIFGDYHIKKLVLFTYFEMSSCIAPTNSTTQSIRGTIPKIPPHVKV